MKVKVINANGAEQWIPDHWLDHPLLGEGFARAEATQAPGKASGHTTAPAQSAGKSIKKEK